MRIIDAHCDTLSAWLSKNDNTQFSHDKVKKIGIPYLQFFAVFCSPSLLKTEGGYEKSVSDISAMFDIYDRNIFNRLYKPVLCKKDITEFELCEISLDSQDDCLYSLLSFEGVYLSKGNVSYMDYLFNKGVRCISFTWNPSNEFGRGVNGDDSQGLSNLGIDAVKKCNELGILLDVSHSNDKSFYDIAHLSKKPFVATHSNSRAQCAHKRNLDDDMLKVLKQKNGVAGINYFSRFLNDHDKNADVFDIVRHIEHISSITGVDHVGLGSDFDGINNAAIPDVSYTNEIFEALLRLNYPESDVNKIASGNFARVLKEVLND